MKNIKSLDKYSVCMSINPKRYEYLCKNFAAVGIKEPKLFKGVRWNRGSNTGCVLAHLSILNMCKNINTPYVIVYEDDCYPRPDIINVWDTIKTKIPENCGILKLGSSSYRGDIVVINDYMYQMKTGTAFGSHAYIVKKELYDRLITTMMELNVPDVAMNLEYYKDMYYKPYVLNFDYQLFIQKNINIDNIISRKGGQRYWYPDEFKHFGCTSGKPCKHFVDRLIQDEDKYLERICVIKCNKWLKGKKTGIVTDDLIYTKDEDGKLERIDGLKFRIKWSNGNVDVLRFDDEIDGIRFYTIL